jgi:WD40 repeat protein
MTAGRTSGVTVWDVDAHESVGTVPVPEGHASLFGAALSPDGAHVMTFAGDNEAAITDVQGADQPLELAGHTSAINDVAYDREGDRAVTASSDGTARIWDANDGDELLALNNDGIDVRGVSFSADGRLVATTGVDGGLAVWDAINGGELLRLQGADESPALSPDGSMIAAADTDSGQISIYECEICEADLDRLEQLAEDRITRDLTDQERALYLGE